MHKIGKQSVAFLIIATMIFWHSIIGIGEIIITCLVLGFLIKVKPDLIQSAEFLNLSLGQVENYGGSKE